MRRLALLVATYRHEDAGLRQLTAPGQDAEALAEVLRHPEIADFEVTILVNEPHHVVGRAIGELYRNRRRDDLTFLYFTGHGLKDDEGRLYLAMTNTRRDDLLFTSLPAQQIDYAMDSCLSRQKVLVLDCCYSGAFPAGRISKADTEVHTLEKFRGNGRVVLTASDATQYSFEGNHIVGQGVRSVFTRFLVEGLTTGEADLDGDGDISLDELYSYVYERVVEEMPQQRPKKQENVEGRIVIARNIHWRPPASVRAAIESTFVRDRLAVLKGLADLHRVGNDLVKAEVINQILRLIHDDNDAVSTGAMKLVTALNPERARLENNEQSQQEAGGPREAPLISSTQPEEEDKSQVVSSATIFLPVADMTSSGGKLEQTPLVDEHQPALPATDEKIPQRPIGTGEQAWPVADRWMAPSWWWEQLRFRLERAIWWDADRQVTAEPQADKYGGLAGGWSLGQLTRHRMLVATSSVMVMLLLILVLLLFTDILGTRPERVVVPDVVGQSVVAAEQTLTDAGFQTERRSVESPPESVDRVVDMNPTGEAISGTTILLDVGAASAEAHVPDVVGTNFDQAHRNITGAGLNTQIQEVDSAATKGQVLRQNPAGGADVKAGTTVTLVVSRGNQLLMPNMRGQTPAQALNTLQRLGWAGTLKQASSPVEDPTHDGIVLNQDVQAGTGFARDQTITITVGQTP